MYFPEVEFLMAMVLSPSCLMFIFSQNQLVTSDLRFKDINLNLQVIDDCF